MLCILYTHHKYSHDDQELDARSCSQQEVKVQCHIHREIELLFYIGTAIAISYLHKHVC